MHAAHKQGEEMPVAIEFTDDDSSKEIEMKQLIVEMTSYEPKDRPSAKDVFHQVYAIYIKKEPTQKVHAYCLVSNSQLSVFSHSLALHFKH